MTQSFRDDWVYAPYVRGDRSAVAIELPGRPGVWTLDGAIGAGIVREFDARFYSIAAEGRARIMHDADMVRNGRLVRS